MERANAVDRDVQTLKTWSKQIEEIGKLQEKHFKAASLLEDHACRIENVESEIVKVREEAAIQRDNQNSDLISLEKIVEKNVGDAARWIDTQRAHVELLSSAGERLQNLEVEQAKLAAFAGNADIEIRGLSSWQHDATPHLECHSIALEEVRKDMSR